MHTSRLERENRYSRFTHSNHSKKACGDFVTRKGYEKEIKNRTIRMTVAVR